MFFSPFPFAVVRDVFSQGLSVRSRVGLLAPIFRAQLLPALGFVTAAVLVMALLRRDRRIMVGGYWMVSVLGSVLLITGPTDAVRYSIIAVPAYCVCAASLVRGARSLGLRRVLTVVLSLAVVWQLWWGRGARPAIEDGYEEAARFVLAAANGRSAPTVLYSASIDTGAFVFFVRKHDPARRLVVLRPTNATFPMGVGVEDGQESQGDLSPARSVRDQVHRD